MNFFKNIVLISALIISLVSFNNSTFAQTNFPSDLKSKLTANQLVELNKCEGLFQRAETKLNEVKAIEQKFENLESKENSEKWEAKIWEAKGKRIDASLYTLEAYSRMNLIYSELLSEILFDDAKEKEQVLVDFSNSSYKFEVAKESLLWFRSKVKKNLANTLNSTVISYIITTSSLQSEAIYIQNEILNLYLSPKVGTLEYSANNN